MPESAPHHALGQFFALLSAASWATSLVLFKQGTESASPIALTLLKNFVGMALFAATILLLLALECFSLIPEEYAAEAHLPNFTPSHFWFLVITGVVGIAIADALFIYCLKQIGVGLFAIVDCLYSPSVVLFGWYYLAESMQWPQYWGAAFVLVAILISSLHGPPPGRTRKQLITGMIFGASASVMMGWGIVFAKPIIEQYSLLWVTLVRLIPGTLALGLFALLLPDRKATLRVLLPSRVWWQAVPGAVLMTYIGIWTWQAGFKYTSAATAGILNQTSTIMALVLATLILHERLTRRKMTSIVLAFVGSILVVTYSKG